MVFLRAKVVKSLALGIFGIIFFVILRAKKQKNAGINVYDALDLTSFPRSEL